MTAPTAQVVVHFRYHGGNYRLEVDESTARRLADAEDSFTPEAETRPRLRDHLRARAHRASRD